MGVLSAIKDYFSVKASSKPAEFPALDGISPSPTPPLGNSEPSVSEKLSDLENPGTMEELHKKCKGNFAHKSKVLL
jgi:hypothetical protein